MQRWPSTRLESLTVVDEETFANQENYVVQPDSKRHKLGLKIFCCCIKRRSGLPEVGIQEDDLTGKFNQPDSVQELGLVELDVGADITKAISIGINAELRNNISGNFNDSSRSENITSSKELQDTNRAL